MTEVASSLIDLAVGYRSAAAARSVFNSTISCTPEPLLWASEVTEPAEIEVCIG